MGTECRNIDWAIKSPIYIMIVKNATKNWACVVYYQWYFIVLATDL